MITRTEATAQILAAKKAKGLTFRAHALTAAGFRPLDAAHGSDSLQSFINLR